MPADSRQKAIEEKESYPWLKGYQAANQVALACPDTLVISISDREGVFMRCYKIYHQKLIS